MLLWQRCKKKKQKRIFYQKSFLIKNRGETKNGPGKTSKDFAASKKYLAASKNKLNDFV